MAKKRLSAERNPSKLEGITIFSYGPEPSSGKGRLQTDTTLGGGIFGFAERRSTVSPEKLQNNLRSFLNSIEKIMEGTPRLLAGFAFEEMELGVEVSAESEVGLLGTGGKVSGKGSITLKLTRP